MRCNPIICLLTLLFTFSLSSNGQPKEKVKDFIKQADTFSQQGAAAYGKYLFQFSAGTTCDIYDLEQRRHIGQMTYEGSEIKHCDAASFGAYKVDVRDEFPVVYISGSQIWKNDARGIIWVYRIIHENYKWNLQLIQQINTPLIKFIGICPDALLSNAEGCMWIMGWNTNLAEPQKDGGGTYLHFTKFKTPKLSDGTLDKEGVRNVTLSMEDAITAFVVNNAHIVQQGVCYKNQKVYVPYGDSSDGYQGIDIVSLEEGRVIRNINLMGTNVKEPEAVFFYNNELFIADQATTIKMVINFKENE